MGIARRGSLFVFGLLLWAACAPVEKRCEADELCGQAQICKEGRCVAGCRSHDDCARGELCMEDACSAVVCVPGASEACYEGESGTQGQGECRAGSRVCLRDGQSWSPCAAQSVAQKEVCDRKDNDCDGTIDEDLSCECTPGEHRQCYTGPSNTRGEGLCRAGVQYCQKDSRWGRCLLQVRPTPELCDQKDNDCNGLVDEYIDCQCKPGAQRPCYGGPEGTKDKGPCRGGLQSCGLDRRWGPCVGQHLPVPEEDALCNGKDDDCDGKVDNGTGEIAPLSRECGAQGSCKAGRQECTAGTWGACTGQSEPRREICNGKDDDCNGKTDDGLDQEPCYPNGASGCQPCAPNESQAQCDRRRAQSGELFFCKGACKAGLRSCQNGAWSPCTQAVTPKSSETCDNGVDDNCDGRADEDCGCKDGDTQPCYTGPATTRGVPPCRDGIQTCKDQRWGACSAQVLPQVEQCNGKDDDCDGQIDDAIPGVNQACQDPSKVGECRNGRSACVRDSKGAYAIVCQAQTPPAPVDACNGKDDDCDGKIDNSPNLNKPCTHPKQKGACAQGQWLCLNPDGKGYKVTCFTQITPQLEFCNGEDDDCNGKTDDLPDLGQACTDHAKKGICNQGAFQCVDLGASKGFAKICKATALPQKEICNGKDDDCDGNIDNLGGSCTLTGLRGQCAVGRYTCKNGAPSCAQIHVPGPEVCDGKDNDCDGQTDEELKDVGRLCRLPGGKGLLGEIQCFQGASFCGPPATRIGGRGFRDAAWLPPGSFSMGSKGAAASSDELPVRQITLTRPFAIQLREATFGEFQSAMGYSPHQRVVTRCNSSNLNDCPTQSMSWHESAAYAVVLSRKYNLDECYTCSPSPGSSVFSGTCVVKSVWAGARFTLCNGFRLPTEAEWEYAYRAGTTDDFYNGQSCPTRADCLNTDPTKASAVEKSLFGFEFIVLNTPIRNSRYLPMLSGLKATNPWGLFDMAGNVPEWVNDWYAPYSSSALVDPVGPSTGARRVMRGGGSFTHAFYGRASTRRSFPPNTISAYSGFRLVRTLAKPFACTTDADCKGLSATPNCDASAKICIK